MTDKMLTVRDISMLTGKSEKTVYRYIKSGRLKARKVSGSYGHLYLIAQEDVEASGLHFIRKKTVGLSTIPGISGIEPVFFRQGQKDLPMAS